MSQVVLVLWVAFQRALMFRKQQHLGLAHQLFLWTMGVNLLRCGILTGTQVVGRRSRRQILQMWMVMKRAVRMKKIIFSQPKTTKTCWTKTNGRKGEIRMTYASRLTASISNKFTGLFLP